MTLVFCCVPGEFLHERPRVPHVHPLPYRRQPPPDPPAVKRDVWAGGPECLPAGLGYLEGGRLPADGVLSGGAGQPKTVPRVVRSSGQSGPHSRDRHCFITYTGSTSIII